MQSIFKELFTYPCDMDMDMDMDIDMDMDMDMDMDVDMDMGQWAMSSYNFHRIGKRNPFIKQITNSANGPGG